MDKVSLKIFFVIFSLLLVISFPAMADQTQEIGTPRWSIDDVPGSDIVPFAIGHRGYGADLEAPPGHPTENTDKAVRRAFREGIMVVEVDANLTEDKVAVALHDDYLPDGTCINTLTLEELKEILPEVSTLRQILKVSRTFSVMKDTDRPSGQVIVEIKIPTPFCVPLEEEQFVLQELVNAVLGDIQFTRMADQVIIESFSPEILAMAAAGAPHIPRMLALDALQLLPVEWIEMFTNYTVNPLPQKTSFGLAWGEIAEKPEEGEDPVWIYRIPGYYPMIPGTDAFTNYIATLYGTGSSLASLDTNVLFMAPTMGSSAASLVEALHDPGIGPGFYVYVFTIGYGHEAEWGYISDAGTDGIMIDNIPFGLTMEGQ